MSTALEIAEYINDMDMFGINTLESKTAGLYSVRGEVTELVAEHGDVYELLDSPLSQAVAQMSDAVAVLTCGWAAPLPTSDSDPEAGVAPSQHSQRRRVRLLVVAKRGDTASALRFADDWANPIFDEGQATGSLADAVQSLFV